MTENERLTKLVALYQKALINITEQEEIEDISGNRGPSLEMSIAINALEEGKELEKELENSGEKI